MRIKKTKKLSKELVKDIKKRLWTGERQSAIAESFGVSQSAISRIASAQIHSDVKWPDGSSGPLIFKRHGVGSNENPWTDTENVKEEKPQPKKRTSGKNPYEKIDKGAQGMELISSKLLQQHQAKREAQLRQSVIGQSPETQNKSPVKVLNIPSIPLPKLLAKYPNDQLLQTVQSLEHPGLQKAVEMVYGSVLKRYPETAEQHLDNQEHIVHLITFCAQKYGIDIPDLEELFTELLPLLETEKD